jgi:hypothetical protein
LRALAPEIDTLDIIPVQALAHLPTDPDRPVPAVGDGMLLAQLPGPAIDKPARTAGARRIDRSCQSSSDSSAASSPGPAAAVACGPRSTHLGSKPAGAVRHRRLRQIKALVDPDDLIRSNHPITGVSCPVQ